MSEELVSVMNRTASKMVYCIPSENIRRELAPGQTIRVPKSEIEKLAYEAGGMNMIRDYLLVEDNQILEDLSVHRELEYNYTAQDVARLVAGSEHLDEYLDMLDFAPAGVIDIVKELAIQLPMTDSNKREALKKKYNYDVDQILIHMRPDKEEEAAAVEEKPKRRAAASAKPARRAKAKSETEE